MDSVVNAMALWLSHKMHLPVRLWSRWLSLRDRDFELPQSPHCEKLCSLAFYSSSCKQLWPSSETVTGILRPPNRLRSKKCVFFLPLGFYTSWHGSQMSPWFVNFERLNHTWISSLFLPFLGQKTGLARLSKWLHTWWWDAVLDPGIKSSVNSSQREE